MINRKNGKNGEGVVTGTPSPFFLPFLFIIRPTAPLVTRLSPCLTLPSPGNAVAVRLVGPALTRRAIVLVTEVAQYVAGPPESGVFP